jgi:hypothetical protein
MPLQTKPTVPLTAPLYRYVVIPTHADSRSKRHTSFDDGGRRTASPTVPSVTKIVLVLKICPLSGVESSALTENGLGGTWLTLPCAIDRLYRYMPIPQRAASRSRRRTIFSPCRTGLDCSARDLRCPMGKVTAGSRRGGHPGRRVGGFTDPPPNAMTRTNAADAPGLRTYLAHGESRHRPCESGTSEGCLSPWLPALADGARMHPISA